MILPPLTPIAFSFPTGTRYRRHCCDHGWPPRFTRPKTPLFETVGRAQRSYAYCRRASRSPPPDCRRSRRGASKPGTRRSPLGPLKWGDAARPTLSSISKVGGERRHCRNVMFSNLQTLATFLLLSARPDRRPALVTPSIDAIAWPIATRPPLMRTGTAGARLWIYWAHGRCARGDDPPIAHVGTSEAYSMLRGSN